MPESPNPPPARTGPWGSPWRHTPPTTAPLEPPEQPKLNEEELQAERDALRTRLAELDQQLAPAAPSPEPAAPTLEEEPLRPPQSCPACGRNETVLTSAPTVPEEVEPPRDPQTGDPIEPGQTVHVCALCGYLSEVFPNETPEQALATLTNRYQQAEADAAAQTEEANHGT